VDYLESHPDDFMPFITTTMNGYKKVSLPTLRCFFNFSPLSPSRTLAVALEHGIRGDAA